MYMNIVYLLTNLDKKEGEKRFYIGSKTESRLEVIDGLSTIIDIKTERPYLGSATDFTMKQDLINRNRFSAEILHIVKERKDLLNIENEEINKRNAVNSFEYYNLSNAIIGGFTYDHEAVINFFGEKRKDFNSSKSGFSKKTKTANRFGFKKVYDFALWIYKEKQNTMYFTDIAKKLNCERHIPARFIESYNMEKCLKETKEINEDLKYQVRDLFKKGASINKISEILNIEIPSVDFYMEDFDKVNERHYMTAKRKNLTEKELKLKILKLVLEGNTVGTAAKTLGINQYSANRYFLKTVREFIKIEDIFN